MPKEGVKRGNLGNSGWMEKQKHDHQRLEEEDAETDICGGEKLFGSIDIYCIVERSPIKTLFLLTLITF